MSTKWNLDPSHSELTFRVKHMMIANLTGKIGSFEVEAESDDEQLTNAKVKVVANMSSISTGDEKRDGHLMSPDFFDVANFPAMTFQSRKMENGKLEGDLTIRDVTRPVVLDVEFGGNGKDPWGNTRAGITVAGKINRKDWNLLWNMPLDTGGVIVSDEVRINGEVELVKS
ncbi:MAG: YceI family protein [Flavobacteriales bacterium]|nr:YceI family protein [Flavobacteriales bacterium]